jgi:hypothetical protein
MTDTTVNDVFLAEGDDARKEIEKKSFVKTKYVKLKDGESIRGFLLDVAPPAYYNHGDYDKGIKSFPCADPKNGKNCLGCQNGIKRTKMLLVPFYNVDTKAIEIFDANAKHGKTIYSFVDQYGDDAVTTPITFKRTGESTSTVYSIMPLPPKAVTTEKALFVVPAELVIDRAFYAEVLTIPDADYIRGLIGLAPTTVDTPPVNADAGELPPVISTDNF